MNFGAKLVKIRSCLNFKEMGLFYESFISVNDCNHSADKKSGDPDDQGFKEEGFSPALVFCLFKGIDVSRNNQ